MSATCFIRYSFFIALFCFLVIRDGGASFEATGLSIGAEKPVILEASSHCQDQHHQETGRVHSGHPLSEASMSGCSHISSTLASYGECALHEGFVTIPHTGRRYLEYLMQRLAPAAGEDPAAYVLDIVREVTGPEYINAMTCAASKVIWVSRKAYQELYGYEPALAYIVAHEIGHGSPRNVFAVNQDVRSWSEDQLYRSLTGKQRHEVVVDQRAADIMLAAGYTDEEVLAGARYILQQEGAELVLRAGPSHPSGSDRVQLLAYYLQRSSGNMMAGNGRVLPAHFYSSRIFTKK